MNQQLYKNMALWVVILVMILLLVTMLRQTQTDNPPLPYSEFLRRMGIEEVIEEIVVTDASDLVSFQATQRFLANRQGRVLANLGCHPMYDMHECHDTYGFASDARMVAACGSLSLTWFIPTYLFGYPDVRKDEAPGRSGGTRPDADRETGRPSGEMASKAAAISGRALRPDRTLDPRTGSPALPPRTRPRRESHRGDGSAMIDTGPMRAARPPGPLGAR